MSDSIFKLTEKTGYESPFGNWLAQTPTISINEIGAFIVVENNFEIIKIEFAVISNIDIKNALVRLCTNETEANKVKGVEMQINVASGGILDNIFFISIARTVYESHLKQTNPLSFFLELHHEGRVYSSLDFDLMWLVELSGDRVYNPNSIGNSSSGDSTKLSKDERSELIRITGDAFNDAYSSFLSAAQDVARIVRDTINAEIEFAFFLADIALGILLPAAGKLLKGLTSSIPTYASNSKFIHAFTLLDESDTTKLLLSGTQVGHKLLKDSYTKLSKIGKIEAFIDRLTVDTEIAFSRMNKNLPNLSDEEITCLYLSFDPVLTNKITYKEVISETVQRFEKQILTIGKSKNTSSTVPQTTTSYNTGVRWMEYKPKKIVLANLTFINKVSITSGGLQNTVVIFNSFIDKDLGTLAEKIGNTVQPNGVILITNSDIKILQDEDLIVNYPKSVPAGKYEKTLN